MRILMTASVDPSVPNASVTHLDGVASFLANVGHDVTLVLPRQTGRSALDPATKGYCICFAGFGQPLGVPRAMSLAVQAPWLAWRIVRGDFDLAYIRAGVLSWPLSFFLRLMSRGVPVITEHNGWISDELKAQGRPAWMQAIIRTFQVWDARASTMVRCVTPGLARKFVENGVAEARLFVAGNGTDIRRFRPMGRTEVLRAMGLREDRFYIGFIGSLAPWHGLTIAISALPAIILTNPRAHFLVAGDGADRRPAEDLARMLGILQHVTFLGHIPTEDAPHVINAFDIAVAPFISARNSSIGLSALKIRDYAACARPIVATDIEGVAPPDDRGWIRLCSPDEPHSLADAIISLMNDKAERQRLGTAARIYAETHFDWEKIVINILNYAFVLSKKN